MKLDYGFFKAFEGQGKALKAQGAKLDEIMSKQATVLINQGIIMATIQELQSDMDVIKQEAGDYIASRDAIDVTLNATIADLTAQLAAGAKSAAEVQTGIDAAFTTAEEAKAALAPPAGVVVPDPANP